MVKDRRLYRHLMQGRSNSIGAFCAAAVSDGVVEVVLEAESEAGPDGGLEVTSAAVSEMESGVAPDGVPGGVPDGVSDGGLAFDSEGEDGSGSNSVMGRS